MPGANGSFLLLVVGYTFVSFSEAVLGLPYGTTWFPTCRIRVVCASHTMSIFASMTFAMTILNKVLLQENVCKVFIMPISKIDFNETLKSENAPSGLDTLHWSAKILQGLVVSPSHKENGK